MSSSLALVVLSVVLVSSCQGVSLSKSNNADRCKNLEDKQPVACRDTLLAMNRQDRYNFCNDYDICMRTCNRCPPLDLKHHHPSVECKDEREDCPFIMRLWGQNNCVKHSSYSYRYCRRYCGLC